MEKIPLVDPTAAAAALFGSAVSAVSGVSGSSITFTESVTENATASLLGIGSMTLTD